MKTKKTNLNKVWLIHGIRSSGEKAVDLLEAPLTQKGYDAGSLDYEKISLWNYISPTKKFNVRIREAAQQIKSLTSDGDIIVTHSNGALVAWDCMRLNRKFSSVICVAPALDRWKNFHFDGAIRILLLVNPHDQALRLTRWLPEWHPGGRMGCSGMQYPESRVSTYAVAHKGKESHSFWFNKDHLDRTANTIDDFIKGRPLNYENKH